MQPVPSKPRTVVSLLLFVTIALPGLALAQPVEGLVGSNDRFFLKMNTATGSATPVSNLGLAGYPTVQGLAFDSNTNTLYGADGGAGPSTGQLLTIDPVTKNVTAVGGLGFDLVYDLAFDPNTNTLYGIVYDPSNGSELITINTATGAGTLVGSLGFTGVTGLAFDPNSNTLYGVENFFSNGNGQLLSIDTATGAATVVATLAISGASSLAFDPNTNTLYGSDGQYLYTINTTTGATTEIGGSLSISGLAFDPNTSTLFGANPNTYQLLTINTSTGDPTAVVNLGVADVEGLAFDPNTHTLYGVSDTSDMLITIDTTTGLGTIVGFVGFSVSALAFDPNTNTLYGHDGRGDQLITIDTTTGAGTAVGLSSSGNALAFDPNTNTLYGATGGAPGGGDQLVTVDPSTGATTVVGSIGFGTVDGLTFDPNTNTLYGSAHTADQLITINTTTGAGTAVNPLGIVFPQALAFDSNANKLYGTSFLTNTLFTIDTTTGASTTVGQGYPSMNGLAYDPDTDTLYGSAASFLMLVTIDRATGEATTIGQTTGFDINDIAFDRNTDTLYGVHRALGEDTTLVAIDTATGAGTAIGPLGSDDQGGSFFDTRGLAFDASTNTLYGSDTTYERLLTIDTSTGQGTAVGPHGSLGYIEGLAFDPITHTLYGVNTDTEELYAIDTATGIPTLVGPTWYTNIAGLAFVTSYSACDEFICPCPGPPQIGSGSFLAIQDDCLESSDGGLRLCLDAGDLAQDETLGVVQTAVNQHDVDLTVSASPGLGVAVALYDLSPDGLVFANPVQVTTVQDVSNYNENQRSRLDLFARDGQGNNLEPLGALCCIDENPPGTFTARCTYELTHFSEYGPVLPEDTDNDGVFDLYDGIQDNCPLVANTDQADSDGNGVGDCCDSSWPGFVDNDGDGIYDLCCTYPAAPMADADSSPKGRYLSFSPGNAGLQTAIRVTPRTLPGFESWEGTPMWVGPPKAFAEENSAQPGLTFMASALSCEPYYQDWSTIDVLYVFGGAVIPGATYDLQTICAGAASLTDESNYSSPLVLTTGTQGDLVPPFAGDGSGTVQPDFTDISSVVSKFLADPGAPIKARAQLQPNTALPWRPIDFNDIAEDVSAFLGDAYPYAGPCTCPSSVTCHSVSCISDVSCGTGYCVDIGSGPRGRGYCIDACGRCTP